MFLTSMTCALGVLLPQAVFNNRIVDARDQATIVQVQQPITVQGTLLQPGEYEFRLDGLAGKSRSGANPG
jgi:hypothetical protein